MPETLYEKTPTTGVAVYEKAYTKYQKLYRLVQPTMKLGDGLKLEKAFHFAMAADKKKQYWEEGVNILQVLDIAWIIAEDIGLGTVSIICALLYDLVEEVTPAEIEKIFGAQVAQTIHRLIKLESLPQLKEIRNEQRSEAVIVALIQDPKVVLLKIAENLQKMRTLDRLPYDQRAGIASHAKHIYVPVAHRLGLHAIKAELEDLHLKFTNAVEYHSLTGQLNGTKHVSERFIERFKRPIQEKLERKKLPFVIKTRIKSVTSIRTKMQATGLPLERVYDIFAIRIILDVPASQAKLCCWQAHEAVTSLYRSHPNKFRNWLSYPRQNGYQALHVTVMSREGIWVEVQIRTQSMDEIAEKGRAAHWRYKEVKKMEQISGLGTWLNKIRIALEREPQSSTELVDTTNTDLKIKKIEVYTPKSQITALPIGATILDFAFELGIASGLRCAGAQVNNKLVAYDHILCHGDRVKIITARKPQILEDWLDCAVTDKAQNAIKKFLQQEKKLKIARGKQLVQKECHHPHHIASHAEYIAQLLVYLDEEKVEDLYYKLGDGSIALRQVLGFPTTPCKARECHRPSRRELRPFVQGLDS